MSEGLAQGPNVAARAGIEPMTLRTKGVDSANALPRPTNVGRYSTETETETGTDTNSKCCCYCHCRCFLGYHRRCCCHDYSYFSELFGDNEVQSRICPDDIPPDDDLLGKSDQLLSQRNEIKVVQCEVILSDKELL